MRYPDEFDTSTFPAGKQLAVSRAVGIAIMVVFLLIIFACGFLLCAKKSSHIHPFLVSINDVTGQWDVVGHQHTETKEITTTQSLQESVIGKFLEYRFRITDDMKFNLNIWQFCDRKKYCNPETKIGLSAEECETLNISSEICSQIYLKSETCALYCLSSDAVHKVFSNSVLETYKKSIEIGETWTPDMSTVQMLPLSDITATGGTWQIRLTIKSNLFGKIRILAYAQVSRNQESYPQTLGYSITNFNAYKIN